MIRGVLESIHGIAFLPLIGLVLFLAVFTGMTIWALSLRKPYLDHMGQLPLHDGELP